MARPLKPGLKYFPQNTDILDDIKLKKLLLRHKAEGYIVYEYVKAEIYRVNGYWKEIHAEYYFDVAYNLRCDLTPELVNEIIKYCLEIDLFSKEIFNKLSILTSFGIQSRYKEIKKRNNIKPELVILKEIIIPRITPGKAGVNRVNDEITGLTPDQLGVSLSSSSTIHNTGNKGKGSNYNYTNIDDVDGNFELSPAKPGEKRDETELSPAKPGEKRDETELSPAKPGEKLKKEKKKSHPFLQEYGNVELVGVDDLLDLYFSANKYSIARETLAINRHMDIEMLKEWAKAFNEFLKTENKTHKTESDWATHFARWLKLQNPDANPKKLNDGTEKSNKAATGAAATKGHQPFSVGSVNQKLNQLPD